VKHGDKRPSDAMAAAPGVSVTIPRTAATVTSRVFASAIGPFPQSSSMLANVVFLNPCLALARYPEIMADADEKPYRAGEAFPRFESYEASLSKRR
jgi:hypothetical protein